jgi:hypothetical protein
MKAAKNSEWPADPFFIVKNAATLAQVTTRTGSWLGVYAAFAIPPKLMCAGRSGAALARKCRTLDLAWPLSVQRAEKRADLPVELGPLHISQEERNWRELKRKAFQAIETARSRLKHAERCSDRPEDRKLRDAAISKARDAERFLNELKKEARNSGTKRGRRASHTHNRRMIAALARLLPPGKQRLGATKDAVPSDVTGPLDKEAKRLRSELIRFCIRVYEARRYTTSGRELFDECGFTPQEWPLINRIFGVGKWYADRARERHPERPRVTSTFSQA